MARLLLGCGALAALCCLLLIALVCYNVLLRYGFNDASIGLQELEWHLYAVLFLVGIPFALYQDSHVRVDLLYAKASPYRRAWINLSGHLLLLLPFQGLLIYYGYGFALEAYVLGERSGDPGGLAFRWLIKAAIAACALLTLIASLHQILKALQTLRTPHPSRPPTAEDAPP